MSKDIMYGMGFHKELQAIAEGKCPLCAKLVDSTQFKDELSLKEFKISGMCRNCQDDMFGAK